MSFCSVVVITKTIFKLHCSKGMFFVTGYFLLSWIAKRIEDPHGTKQILDKYTVVYASRKRNLENAHTNTYDWQMIHWEIKSIRDWQFFFIPNKKEKSDVVVSDIKSVCVDIYGRYNYKVGHVTTISFSPYLHLCCNMEKGDRINK